MKVRVSDYIVSYLEKLGTEAAFLLSGGGMMHVLDAFSRSEKIRYFCNHHEQACAIAADSYARVSGKIGVCLATSGPGGTNTITGVVGAWQDSSPVLFISGQSKVSQTIRGTELHGLRQFGTFEVDILPLVESITKYAAFVSTPNSIRYHLEKACHLALTGRPGPVFLDIPVDVQGALVDPSTMPGYEPESESANPELSSEMSFILEKLKKAKRPVLLAGHGIRSSNANSSFFQLVEQLQIPVVTTPFAADLFPYSHPLYIGHPGMKGDRAGNLAIQASDFLLVLGSSLHITTTGYEVDQFAKSAYKIHVDPDPMIFKRDLVGVDRKIQSDLKEFISGFSKLVTDQKFFSKAGQWLQHCQFLKAELSVRNEKHVRVGTSIHLYDVLESISGLTNGTETLVTDAGSTFYVVGQAYRVQGQQRVITSGSLGAMGFALPAATGAAVSNPQSQVICLTGEGSLQTNIHELATIAQNRLNIALVIINNDGYFSIRNMQNNFFKGHVVGSDTRSGVMFPDLEKLSAAYGIPYKSTRELGKLSDLLGEVLSMKGPVIFEVYTNPDQEIIPTVSSVKLEDGSMRSKPLHDMYPFMTEEELKKYFRQDSDS